MEGPGDEKEGEARSTGGGNLGGGVLLGIKEDFGIVFGRLHAFNLSIDTVYGSPFFKILKNFSPASRTGKGPL